VLWGWLFLKEIVTANMVIACVVILLGVALTTGRSSEPLPAPIADKA
jgi:drug/metabolite transporter (DMT)-like permease